MVFPSKHLPAVRLSAVLFDYDGVTARTCEINYSAWRQVFAQVGVCIGEREYYLLEGYGPKNVSAALCHNHGLDKSRIEELARAKEDYVRTLSDPEIYQEIPELLESLRGAGITLGLVTGASRHRIDQTLPKFIRSYYGTIITSDDVVNTKPDPEPYLKAAAALECPIGEALVVENAPLGIASAKSGGFFCIAVGTTLPAEKLKQADVVVSDHTGMTHAIFQLCGLSV